MLQKNKIMSLNTPHKYKVSKKERISRVLWNCKTLHFIVLNYVELSTVKCQIIKSCCEFDVLVIVLVIFSVSLEKPLSNGHNLCFSICYRAAKIKYVYSNSTGLWTFFYRHFVLLKFYKNSCIKII
jgi:hypothetical protein